MLFIIYLLEDEQQLSLGMLIRPKRISRHDIDALSYTFDHIWTNLLTQCTPVLVPVFCCFSISGFPRIKNAPKIPRKYNKKSVLRKLRESPRRGQRGPTRDPGALPARPRLG